MKEMKGGKKMKKTIFTFLFILLATSLILAGNKSQNEQQILGQEIEIRISEGLQERIQEKLQNSTFFGKEIKIKSENGKEIEIEFEGIKAKSKINLSSEYDEFENTTAIRAELSNGKNYSIKVMPDEASQKAIEKLQLKVCNPEEGCQIELKEVGEKNQAKATYEIKAKKEGKFLGLFKTKIDVEVQVDAETGEVIKTKKAWWAFLTSE